MSSISRAAIAAALFSAASMDAGAQQPASAPLPGASAATTSVAATLGKYRSAFEGYRPFDEQKVGSWRSANEVVGEIGGWQAYAREGQDRGGAAPGPAAPVRADGKADATATGGGAAAQRASPGAHSGHGKP